MKDQRKSFGSLAKYRVKTNSVSEDHSGRPQRRRRRKSERNKMSSPIKLPPKGEVIRVKTLLGTIFEEKFQIFQKESSLRYNEPKLPVPYTRPPVTKVQIQKVS